MNRLNDILTQIDGYIGGSQWFVFLLLGTGLFFTIYLRFPQFRYLKPAFRIVRGKFDREGDVGDTSHFQALMTALSGTVGTGNIAGVALAIHLGGPAALFWMWVTALLGMTLKFVEVSISHKYREKAEDGTIAGGPMYYMRNRLNMKWLAVIFAVATIFSSFGTGNLPQINSISNSIFATFGINKILTGAVLSILLGFVIIGGIKRIAKVTSRLVPLMAIIYFLGAMAVILFNYENIIPSFISIFSDLFTGTSAAGGFLGAGFSFAFNRGVNRGLFSNEAGQGSAPIAHATARAHEPISEGLVALLGPFIDTIIICTLTGLVILSSGVWSKKIDNQFQDADIQILAGQYDEHDTADREKLANFLQEKADLPLYSGSIEVADGVIQSEVTVLHSRSVADDVLVSKDGNQFTGTVVVVNGNIANAEEVVLTGKSLIHSAPLTTEAFTKSWFGSYGRYIVSIGLLLFAFSTAISWSYYGDRAVNFLFGMKGEIYFRIVYVIGFFFASFTDTTLIWTISGITIVIMTVPNLIGILLLRKEMKSEVKNFWKEYAEVFKEDKKYS
ncbi:sodium:alanine symporter family protein [uncultured Sunxiuqinia sp.]|uniref:alanine/glycine:cation symporter family protein n=1 Tax=uncultured Sunxiuqinia sp. TaxID=1573825 RepID=UPI002AA7AD91|nr:sodium:alanine symporter family protein [uncultured Sunxiuqinia sp.]